MMTTAVEHLAERGVEMQEALLARVKPGGRWRPDAWHRILAAVRDEAQFFEECEPQSVCAYAFLVEVAAMHLEDNHHQKRAHELFSLISRNLLVFAHSAEGMSDAVLQDDEKQVMALSLEGLHLVAQTLRTMYPGTP